MARLVGTETSILFMSYIILKGPLIAQLPEEGQPMWTMTMTKAFRDRFACLGSYILNMYFGAIYDDETLRHNRWY